MSKPLLLPQLGENIETVTVSAVRVKAGDTVKEEQTLLDIESDKAVVEVPAPEAGRITKIMVSEGDSISAGQAYAEIEPSGESGPAEDSKPGEPSKDTETSVSSAESAAETETAAAPETAAKTEPAVDPAPAAEPPKRQAAPAAGAPAARHVPAAPSVRRFAREVGVDIDTIRGSGPHGRVSVEDVKRHLRERKSSAQDAVGMAPPLPDFSRWGSVRRERMSGIRVATARQVSVSWQAIPRVTHFDQVDITNLELLRKRYADRAAAQGGKLTMAVMVVKTAAVALRKFPQFNASIDMAAREIVYKDYVNIGIAVATERGLLVPVLRDADRKNMIELAVEIDMIARKCREGRIQPAELQGGTFTVTNLGAIGGTHFTPIINTPEVAILGMGRATEQMSVVDGQPQPATILPLSLSYDHRLIDGAHAARFVRWMAEAIAEPLILSLEGTT